MSFEAVAAVMNADIRPPSLKLAAVAMGNFLNSETGQLNPSMGRIARACGLSDVQARRQVHELIAMGILSVEANHDGGSAGASRQYRLHLDRLPATPLTSDRPTPIASDTPLISDSPLTGDRHPSHGRALPLSPVIATPLTSETLIRKESRKNQEGTSNKGSRSRPFDAGLIDLPEWLDRDTWGRWVRDRKTRNKPITEEAAKLQVKKLGEHLAAGFTPETVIDNAIENAWQGLYEPKNKPRTATRHAGFASKNYREGISEDGTFV